MGTTTYTGAVRSENGFSDISKNSDTGAVTTNSTYSNNASVGGTLAVTQSITGKKSINTDFNAAGALTQTLTAAQSGTLFLINGTANNVVNMPALSTENVGVHYEFQLTVAVGGSTTTTFVLPGSAVSAFQGMVSLVAGTAANAVSDVAGDTLTLVNSTVLNARVSVTCVSDDGTNSKWMTTVLSTPIATIA
tara:strand:- start:2154 stop:2729 length:576 start_codon:yes stop_codon:yes gene_type:complete